MPLEAPGESALRTVPGPRQHDDDVELLAWDGLGEADDHRCAEVVQLVDDASVAGVGHVPSSGIGRRTGDDMMVQE